jgi:hypothetical protein
MAIYFPNSGSFSLSGLTFSTTTATAQPSSNLFNRAQVLVAVDGIPAGVTVTFSNFKLSGQGITTTLDYAGTVTRTSANNLSLYNPEEDELFPPGGFYEGRPRTLLNTTLSSWNSSNNLVSFDVSPNGILPGEARIFYAVMYSSNTQTNTAYSNITLAAFPTFGLPIGSIGVITSRFGTVGNYLRLRNQGQV